MENQNNIFIVIGLTILILGGLFVLLNNFNGNKTVANSTKGVVSGVSTNSDERVAKPGDHVYVHYTGKLTNGTVFDSSITRGTPFDFDLGAGQVIKGWDEGIVGMKVGDKKTLTIPPEKGYGSRATGSIPANSTLIFDVELMDIK